jgi:O-antigen/teichoic acid export membrane protein
VNPIEDEAALKAAVRGAKDQEPAPMQLKERAMRSSTWTIAEYLVSNLLRFGSNLVLAYALFPEAFAIVAYASIVLQGLTMLSDIGIGPSIVRSPRGNDPDFLNTAWTVQVIRGLVLFLISLLLGWPMAWFYNEPQLAWLVPACGLNFISTGLQSTNIHTLNRDLNLGRNVMAGMIEAILKAVITISWALIWPSVWALVGGAFISYVVGSILTHTMLPGIRNRFRWDPTAVREILHFGGWIMLSTLLTFLAGQADRLILGKLVAMGTVGVYSIALMFVRLPYEVGSRLAEVVLFPVLSDVARNDRDTLRAKLLDSRDAILAIVQLGLVVVIIGSPWFFKLLYDARYSEAAFFAPLLAGTVWFAILWACAYPALLAIGDARTIAVSNFANLVVTVAGCLAGFQLDGMRGFIIGVGVGNLAGYSVVSWALARRGLSIFAQDLRYTALIALPVAIATGLPHVIGSLDTLAWRIALALVGVSMAVYQAWHRVGNIASMALRMLRRR